MAGTLSARQAADLCQVSERTIRNWISAGKLAAERTPEGFRVREEDLAGKVPSPSEGSVATSGRNGSIPANAADLSALVDLVRELLPKAEAAAMWQARAELLAAQLEQAQRALEAPRAPEPSPDALQRDSEPLPVEPAQEPPPPKRPWWHFW